MELNPYSSIKDLDSSTFDWKCRVRLQNLWKGIKRDTLEFYGINMILIDDSNSRIHAFASTKYCEDILKRISEGQIYILSNFRVKDFLGDETYRPIRNKKHIYFTVHTKLEKDENQGLHIEDYAFDLYQMGEIEKLAKDNRFLIDMAGKVENLQTIVTTTKNNQEKKMLKFEISDGRKGVKVTLFDNFGEMVDKQFKALDNMNIFIIISCARVGTYDGSPNLTNYPATRIYINPDHYSMKELKNRFQLNQSGDVSNQEVEMTKKLLTVKEIRNLPPNYSEREVLCQVTVKKLDENVSWYYSRCTGCKIEIYRENGIFKCNNCPRIIPYPDKRFRVCTFCSDASGCIPIIFHDSDVSRITDTTVVDIHSECLTAEEEDKFPQILKRFMNQKYTVTIKLQDDNLKQESTVYEAEQIVESLETLETCDSFDPNKEVSMEIKGESAMKETQREQILNETPPTGNSTNVKTIKRKDIEPILYDPNDNPMLEQLKNIKKEKI